MTVIDAPPTTRVPDLSLIPRDVVFVDTETTGLDERHEVVELAYAVGGDDPTTLVVPHIGLTADPQALMINGYHQRRLDDRTTWCNKGHLRAFATIARGKSLAGSNPTFDAVRLIRLFGWNAATTPWNHRLIDVPVFTAAMLGLDRSPGLASISRTLRERGWVISEPDHTAAGDVRTAQDVYAAWREMYLDFTAASAAATAAGR